MSDSDEELAQEDMIEMYLEQYIDPLLEAAHIPLLDRPLRAAVEFSRTFIIEVKVRGAPAQKPADMPYFLSEPWFKIIYRSTEKWYQERLGESLKQRNIPLAGAVLIYGVPFRVEVPGDVSRILVEGEKLAVRFPDAVLEEEEVTSWLVDPPNLSAMPPGTLAETKEKITEVADALRSIRINFMTAGGTDELLNMQKGVLAHLAAFVGLVRFQESQGIQMAYWELQMSCELVFKAVTLQRTGAFRQTHDLFRLYDDLNAAHPIQLDRDMLKRLPPHKEMLKLRYGGGSPKSLADCFHCYRTALAVAKSIAISAKRRLNIGKGEFHLARPPWLQD